MEDFVWDVSGGKFLCGVLMVGRWRMVCRLWRRVCSV
jgi:hypothetical protein